jgi:Lrp/AsnC family transcriptional regulator of ectoine degradation
MKNIIELDKIDMKIILALNKDGRMTKIQLSEEVGLSATPCWERMKKLEKKGVIKGYYAEIDLNKIVDYSASCVELSIKNYSVTTVAVFEKLVRSIPEIVSCEAVLGDIDYILKILSRDVEEYQKSIQTLLQHPQLDIEHKTLVVSKTVKYPTHTNSKEIHSKYISE